VYGLTVMFFDLTNLLVIFQVMINDILRDLIDTGDIAAFMNNVLVETKDKEKHNKIVEKVLKRMEKSDLYIKPEKCVWKVKEINFLRSIISFIIPDMLYMNL